MRNWENVGRTISAWAVDTIMLKAQADYLTPDGSEIRLLPFVNGGGLGQRALWAGKASSLLRAAE